jgi:hypothetical protein
MLSYVSIALEFMIVLVGLRIIIVKKRAYGAGFMATFGIYAVWGLAQQLDLGLPGDVLDIMYFLATLSALFTVGYLSFRRA